MFKAIGIITVLLVIIIAVLGGMAGKNGAAALTQHNNEIARVAAETNK